MRTRDSVATVNRIEFSLGEEEYEAAKAEAERLGLPFAELCRRSLRAFLCDDPAKPWMRYAGMVESGRADSNRTIDDVVHGDRG